jgi:hypothetical protein
MEDEVPIERMDSATGRTLEAVGAVHMVPEALVVVGRRWNPSVFCFFDEFDDWSTFFDMVSEY